MFILRDYQKDAVEKGLEFFRDKKSKKPSIIVAPTGAGKSLIVANIAKELTDPVLVLQPSKELLEQNYNKYISYGETASIFSASFGKKEISHVTFATIGSIKSKPELFKDFKYVISDECFTYRQGIITENGIEKIGKIVEDFLNNKITPLVKSYNEKLNIFEYKKIINARKIKNRETIKIIGNNENIICTPNQKFLTDNGWKYASKLKNGEKILCSDFKNDNTTILLKNIHMDIIYGSILGDGNVSWSNSKNVARLKVIHSKKQEEYLKWKAKIFNSKIEYIKENGYSKTEAYRFCTKMFYLKQTDNLKKEAIKNLNYRSLAIAWMDDGNLYKKQNGGSLYSTAESYNNTILLQKKLIKIGIKTKLCEKKSSSTKKIYYYLSFNKINVIKLSKLIAPYIHWSMQYKIVDKYRYMIKDFNYKSISDCFGCNIVQKIKKHKLTTVYDIEVDDNHTFLIKNYNHSVKTTHYNKRKDGMIVHNCHLNPPSKTSMFCKFFEDLNVKILGLTATPFRLKSYNFPDRHSKLNMLMRERPKIFKDIISVTQIKDLYNQQYLCPLKYVQDVSDQSLLRVNSTGADFTDESKDRFEQEQEICKKIAIGCQKVKSRKHVLIFVPTLIQGEKVCKFLSGCEFVHSKLKAKERDAIIKRFKSGETKYVVNVGVLGIGFDFPELDMIIDASPTLSLARYYQRLGRLLRPHISKLDGLIVDLVGNYQRFGKIEDLEILNTTKDGWGVFSKGKILTGVSMT